MDVPQHKINSEIYYDMFFQQKKAANCYKWYKKILKKMMCCYGNLIYSGLVSVTPLIILLKQLKLHLIEYLHHSDALKY